MNKEELVAKIQDIEWEDFEVKAARTELPKNIWETVSAFANTSGGYIVLGVAQQGGRFVVEGVQNVEKIEQDFYSALRSKKFNTHLAVTMKRLVIDGCNILTVRIPSSPFKPVYFNVPSNTFLRCGSGDQQATDMEIMAMQREQAFGCKSELSIPETTLEDLDSASLDSYRRAIVNFNPSFAYNNLSDCDISKVAKIC